MKQRFSLRSSAAGVNTRDHATTIAENECTKLINAYPSNGTPRPREGLSNWNSRVDESNLVGVVKSIPYSSDNFGEVLFLIKDDGTISWLQGSGSGGTSIGSHGNLITTPNDVAVVGRNGRMFLFSDVDSDLNIIIEEGPTGFSIKENFVHNVGRDNPDVTRQDPRWVALRDDLGSTFGIDSPNNSNEVSKTVKLNSHLYMFAAYYQTYVRRSDALADFSNPSSAFHEGDLESNANLIDNVRIAVLSKENIDHDALLEWSDIWILAPYNGAIFKETDADGLITLWKVEDEDQLPSVIDRGKARPTESYASEYIPDDVVGDEDGKPHIGISLPSEGSSSATPYAFTTQEDITHVRFYRTQFFTTLDEAYGGTPRYLIDVPVGYSTPIPNHSSVWGIVDTTSQAELLGETNTLVTVGTAPPPEGNLAKYMNGFLWIGGNDQYRGRFWHSIPPESATNIDKYLLHFQPESNYMDPNQGSGNSAMGIAESTDFLILFMQRDVYGVFKGDPNSGPVRLSSTHGCIATGSITEVDQAVLFLSEEGPAVVQGREVKTMSTFKAGEVWPLRGSNTVEVGDKDADSTTYSDNGFVHIDTTNIFEFQDPTDLQNTVAVYHDNSWYLSFRYSKDGVEYGFIVCYYSSSIGEAVGAWHFMPGFKEDSQFTLQDIVQWSETSSVMIRRDERVFPIMKLDTRVNTDIGSEFIVAQKSRRHFADEQDRKKAGEIWDIWFYQKITDPDAIRVGVLINGKTAAISQTAQTQVIDNQNASQAAMKNFLQFVFPEGFYFNFLEVEWQKRYKGDFEMLGWDCNYIKYEEPIPVFLSTDIEFIEPIPDDGIGAMTITGACPVFRSEDP